MIQSRLQQRKVNEMDKLLEVIVIASFSVLGYIIAEYNYDYVLKKSEYECVEVINNKCTTYVLKGEK